MATTSVIHGKVEMDLESHYGALADLLLWCCWYVLAMGRWNSSLIQPYCCISTVHQYKLSYLACFSFYTYCLYVALSFFFSRFLLHTETILYLYLTVSTTKTNRF